MPDPVITVTPDAVTMVLPSPIIAVMPVPVITNSGVVYNNANGAISITLPSSPVISAMVIDGETQITVSDPHSNAVSGGITGPNRLDTLDDVDIVSEVDGAVPVYDANTDTFDIKPLPLDGGFF